MISAEDEAALARMMRAFDTAKRIEWTPEMRLGALAFDRMVSEFERGALTVNQRCNAASALFRLREHGKPERIWEVLESLALDSNKKVRTVAATLLVGLLRLAVRPPANSSARDRLAASSILGLEVDAANLVSDYLASKLPPLRGTFD